MTGELTKLFPNNGNDTLSHMAIQLLGITFRRSLSDDSFGRRSHSEGAQSKLFSGSYWINYVIPTMPSR